MKHVQRPWIFLLPALFLLLSCHPWNVDPPCGDPMPNFIELSLVDSSDSLLVGKIYDPDSIRMSVNNEQADLYLQHGVIIINYAGFQQYSTGNFILYLSKEDQDTLNFNIHQVHTKDCGSYLTLELFQYNQKYIYPKDGHYSYRVVK
jgi:hypothetical protein